MGIRYNRLIFALGNRSTPCHPFVQKKTADQHNWVSGVTAYGRVAATTFLSDALDVSAGPESGKRVNGESAPLAPARCERAHIRPKRAAEKLLGSHQVTGLLKARQLFPVNKSGV
jgi:hypothetical protein